MNFKIKLMSKANIIFFTLLNASWQLLQKQKLFNRVAILIVATLL